MENRQNQNFFSYSKNLSSEGHFSSRNCKNYANRRLYALSNTTQRFFRRKKVIFSKKVPNFAIFSEIFKMFTNDENFRYDHESQDLMTLDIN